MCTGTCLDNFGYGFRVWVFLGDIIGISSVGGGSELEGFSSLRFVWGYD